MSVKFTLRTYTCSCTNKQSITENPVGFIDIFPIRFSAAVRSGARVEHPASSQAAEIVTAILLIRLHIF